MNQGELDRTQITGLVLAGGLARRMQGPADQPPVDKGLMPLRGRPLVAHAIDRLKPQVGGLLINANRNQADYARLGVPVIPDQVGGFAGPLAGLHAGLTASTTAWLVTVPCDSPYFPEDLVARLHAAAIEAGADVAVAKTGAQPHPVFALVRARLLPDLTAFLAGGGRKIDRWYAPLAVVEVVFDDERAFGNINTREELDASERLRGRPDRWRPLEAVCRDEPGYDPGSLPVDGARSIIERFIHPIAAVESVPVMQCLGRIVAADVVSPIDVPPHDNSAMDGYAVRSADLASDRTPAGGTRLRVIGSAFAGAPFNGGIGPGEALRIMTGAVMPAGADTVVPQEAVQLSGSADGATLPTVLIPPGQQAGQHRRLRGEDLARGRAAVKTGRRLAAADLGLAASLGLDSLPVRRRARVAFFSTGDELLSAGESPAPGKVYDSNRYTIHAMLTRLGVEPVDLGVVRDRPDALEAAMRHAASVADAVVSSGGVSVGEADFTRDVMARVGDVAFWTIAMRPGRPMAFGRVGDACYFGLPGNPVAVMVTFLFFVREALERLMGAEPRPLPRIRARSSAAVRKRPGRTEYQRATLSPGPDGFYDATITGSQGSGVLRSMSEADCMMVLGHAQGNVAAGDWVDVIPFRGLL